MKVFSPPILPLGRLKQLIPETGGGAFISVKDPQFGAVGDGVADDAPAIQKALTVTAGTGVAVWFPTGNYLLASTGLRVPSDTIIWGSPDATIVSTLPSGALGPLTCPFYAAGAYGADNALTANALAGATVIHVTVPVAPGDILIVSTGDGFHGSRYEAESVSGGGLVVVLDRALALDYTMAAGAKVRKLTGGPEHIYVDGNGMSVVGTGERYFEMLSAFQCTIADVNFGDQANGSTTDTQDAVSWDSYCVECFGYRCTLRDITGFAIESSERCYWVGCRATGKTLLNTGFLIIDCVKCDIVDCSAFGFFNGTVLSAGSANIIGCVDCAVVRGLFCGNANFGVETVTGSGFALEEVVARGNGFYGFSIAGPTKASIIASDNANGALVSNAAVRFESCDVSGNLGFGLQLAASAIICNFVSTGGNPSGTLQVQANSTVKVVGFDISIANSVATFGIQVSAASSRLTLAKGHLAIDVAGSAGIEVSAGVLRIDDVYVDGTGLGGSFGIQAQAGSTVRLSGYVNAGNDQFVGGSFVNRGSFVLNPAVPTVVPFPDLNAYDNVKLTLVALGGAGTGLSPRTVETPTTGFTTTGGAADTSTWAYEIS